MQFTNHFEVPLPPEQAWALLLDVERMVPCMPGAELVEIVDDKTFKGKVSVRLGPVALTFVCLATFESVDNVAHVATIKSQGADAKGRGNANATIGFKVEPSEKGSRATIVTDLNLTGTVAQYGRGAGMIQTVANQIVSQFARNLEAQIEEKNQGQAPAQQQAVAEVASSAQADGAAVAPAPAAPRPAVPQTPAKPIGGLSLIASVLWQTISGWFRGNPSK
jgi:carbon monoxide dehydrogenase subunit G